MRVIDDGFDYEGMKPWDVISRQVSQAIDLYRSVSLSMGTMSFRRVHRSSLPSGDESVLRGYICVLCNEEKARFRRHELSARRNNNKDRKVQQRNRSRVYSFINRLSSS